MTTNPYRNVGETKKDMKKFRHRYTHIYDEKITITTITLDIEILFAYFIALFALFTRFYKTSGGILTKTQKSAYLRLTKPHRVYSSWS